MRRLFRLCLFIEKLNTKNLKQKINSMKQHHHHHHEDDASIFVRETKAAKKRKKIFMQALFVTMCILAFVIVAYAIYIYI